MKTDQSPEGDKLYTIMFQKLVLEGLPEPVRIKLEVIRLYSKTEPQFCEHLTHAVDKYRKAEQKLKEEGKKHSKEGSSVAVWRTDGQEQKDR